MTSSRAADIDDTPFEERHVLLYLGLVMEQCRDLIVASRTRDHLRPSQFRVIAMVPYNRGITITELADRVGMTKQAIGQFVTALVDSGHLVTEEDPRDRRLRIVRRTRRGDEVTQELAHLLDRLEQRWADRVGVRRYSQFRQTLEEIALS
ncbi:MAG TPA: helix-turn-helix domain-containing protein [Nocardioides sp.]|uniref:helix-turn-helix domain-containing protein n=1 Tax=Nocardioides sp. TaxID=35761 RepID=UPI002E2F472A|nr:helix-turn-helix domain-containing protein [Nocardioides sp.]HEX5090440.1 helix-turn-helix domain-containing protein [Nocardioides sp.]